MSVTIQASYFVLRLPIKSESSELRVVDYKISKLLLSLFTPPAFGPGSTYSLLPDTGAVVVDMITIFDEDDQSMRDLLQYLLHPHHFPICLENYRNLYRLAQKFQMLSLVAEIIDFMIQCTELPTVFLYACEVNLQPVIAALEDKIVEQFPSFILNQTREQLAVIDSEVMRRLIYKFLQVASPGLQGPTSIEQTQAFRLLYSYALQKELYEDMLNMLGVLAQPKADMSSLSSPLKSPHMLSEQPSSSTLRKKASWQSVGSVGRSKSAAGSTASRRGLWSQIQKLH